MKDTKWHYLSDNDWPKTGMQNYLVAYLDQHEIGRVTEARYNMTGQYFYSFDLEYRLNIQDYQAYAWCEKPRAPEYK